MSRPVHVLATFQANPGKEKSGEEMLEGLVDPTHQEEGCVSYILQRRIDRPGTYYIIETWRTTADFRKHLASAHLSAVMAPKDELFAVPGIAFFAPVVARNPSQTQYGSLPSYDHTAKE